MVDDLEDTNDEYEWGKDENFDGAELFESDEGDKLLFIIQSVLPSKQEELSQQHSLFRTPYTINKVVCDVINDSESCENNVSKATMKALQLPLEEHPRPYKIGWIKKGVETQVKILQR